MIQIYFTGSGQSSLTRFQSFIILLLWFRSWDDIWSAKVDHIANDPGYIRWPKGLRSDINTAYHLFIGLLVLQIYLNTKQKLNAEIEISPSAARKGFGLCGMLNFIQYPPTAKALDVHSYSCTVLIVSNGIDSSFIHQPSASLNFSKALSPQ